MLMKAPTVDSTGKREKLCSLYGVGSVKTSKGVGLIDTSSSYQAKATSCRKEERTLILKSSLNRRKNDHEGNDTKIQYKGGRDLTIEGRTEIQGTTP